ncbi:MAG TPA: DmsC/YnfH family molybdoenzyme membrane anchor subunit [Candidatus Didemnitutus sp.]|nr:DmsC/YnfH family molybdoenzyme membrane anchor subunit [Candidatus Didemnitutus sp.]
MSRKQRPPADGEIRTLVDSYLEEQQRLQTPVARFASEFESGTPPALASVYRDLIPLSAPAPGQQYAFEVELDACTGCKACVAACHALNGLDETEAWRDTGVVLGGTAEAPFQQTVTTACHHCADPACLNGCPVLAYEKDPHTGIVRHLDDQCIGCQYCVLKCPYDVPKYNARLGIVRKCDMCHQRLAVGEAPACVQACPTQAIRIVTVQVTRTETVQVDTSAFLGVAPDPSYTQPTTRYVSARQPPANLHAADAGTLRLQDPHWPLAVMLTLLPAAIGLQWARAESIAATARIPGWTPLALGIAGMTAAFFHLGQPWRAWRVFLGLRRSWFSREVVLLGAWLGLSVLDLVTPVVRPVTAVIGGLGLVCSVMIYVDTRRTFWAFRRTAPQFLGAALVCGLAIPFPLATASVLVVRMGWEAFGLRGQSASARLQRGPLRTVTTARYVLGAVATAFFCLAAIGGGHAAACWIALGMTIAGELADRHIFFRVVDAPKMPGMPAEVASPLGDEMLAA